MEVSSLICGDACLHHGRETNKTGRAHNFWISFSNKSNFFFYTLKSGNEKVNVLMVILPQLLYTNSWCGFFMFFCRFLMLIILPFVLLCMEEIPFLARYTLPSVHCQ